MAGPSCYEGLSQDSYFHSIWTLPIQHNAIWTEGGSCYLSTDDHVIHGLDFAAVYLDDLIIFSESWEEHLTHIQMVLKQLHQVGLTAKARKCEFGVSECNYLGHIVGSGIAKPEEDKTAEV